MARLRPQDSERRRQRENAHDFSEALARGLAVLGAFGPDRRQATLSDLARALDLPRSTVRRSLLTLAAQGLVETDGRLFRVTPKVMALAAAFLRSNPATPLLQPVCEAVCAELETLCSASVLDREEAVLVARAAPAQRQHIGIGVGFRMPAFCSAGGRVLLAALPDAALDAYLDRLQPQPQTVFTLTDKTRLREVILAVRAEGHALVSEETELGLRSIALPVPDGRGGVIAAIGIGLHAEKGSVDMLRGHCLDLLRRRLAGLPPRPA